MNIVEYKAAWVLKFAVHLHKVQPTVSGTEASRIALQRYVVDHAMAPEEAVSRYERDAAHHRLNAPSN